MTITTVEVDFQKTLRDVSEGLAELQWQLTRWDYLRDARTAMRNERIDFGVVLSRRAEVLSALIAAARRVVG